MPNSRPHAVDPTIATARLVLVYKTNDQDSPSHVGLGVIAAGTAKTLRSAGLWAEAWGCTDAANLRARLDRALGRGDGTRSAPTDARHHPRPVGGNE
jgi:hypothetical protein